MTSAVVKQGTNAVKFSACWVWRPKIKTQVSNGLGLRDTRIFDSGCSRHMTGNKSFLSDYQEYDGGFVAFAESSKRGQEGKEKVSDQEYILLPVLNISSDVPSSNEEVLSSPKDDAGNKLTVEPTCDEGGKIDDLGCLDQQIKSTDDSENTNSTNSFNTASPTVNTASDKDRTFQRTYGEWNFSTPITVNAAGSSFSHLAALDDFSKIPNLEDTRTFDDAYDDRDEGAEADYNNLEIVIPMEPKKVTQALDDESWVEAINNRDQKGIAVRNKAWMVAQGHRQEESIDYDEVFAHVTRIEAISQLLGFMDPEFPDRVYKVEKALYGLHQAHRAWSKTLSNYLLENGFRRGTIDKTLFIKKIKNDILLVQVYVDDIIFGSIKRPDIMFAVCACSRFQVQPKVSHMHAVKRIFRYLKGQPTLGLWYPKDSPLELIAYSNSDYAGASLDRKFTTGGCQFLGSRLISWQCKKQTIVAISTTKAEYIAASNYCGQVLWLQNQLLYYGYNFMQTKIHVDYESEICVVKNPVYHSKTKHIKIRHHSLETPMRKG
nr:putative ribonuclease H-like domain-containing protein [Tanacetum cinerariifolium]